MKRKYIVFIMLLIIFSCKEEIHLDRIDYEQIMVVDGLITNDPGPYAVRLSLNCPLDEEYSLPLERCTVKIIESTGNTEILNEINPGIYTTSEYGIQGIIGNRYKIQIITAEGKEYESDFQEMTRAVEIDSVYTEIEYVKKSGYAHDIPGYQFYIDTKLTENSENYLLWTMDETYQYTANYLVYSTEYTDSTLEYYKSLYRCWKNEDVKYFFTGKTDNLLIPEIKGQPLHFVGTESRKLQEVYSLRVKQYALNCNDFTFWKNVQDQISSSNSLFEAQPFNVQGNIRNINDEEETIFGNFTVASVDKKRLFVDSPRVPFYYDDACSMNYNLDDILYSVPTFLVVTEFGVGIVSEACIDCTSQGGETTKPDFWIY